MADSMTDSLDYGNSIIKRCIADPHISKQFDIIGQIGEGGYGTVLKVRLRTDKQIYALKLIPVDSENKDKLLREAEVLSSLQHTNIVRYYTSWMMGSSIDDEDEDEDMNEDDKDEANEKNQDDENKDDDDGIVFFQSLEEISLDDDKESMEKRSVSNEENDDISEAFEILCIKMEFCSTTLRDFIKTETARTVNSIEQIFNEMVAGITYIHQKGIMHRDIKPENIFFTYDKHIKIGDFGLSCSNTVSQETDAETSTDDEKHPCNTPHVGTYLYMAPEIREKSFKGYGKDVDWFSLGVILLELCYVFETGAHRADVLNKIGTDREIKLPDDFDIKGIGKEHFKNKILILLDHNPDIRSSAVQTRRQNMVITWYETSGFCNVCKLELAAIDDLKVHVETEEHRDSKIDWSKNNKGQGQMQQWCAVCQILCSGSESLITHASGKQHASKSQSKRDYYCDICDLYATGSRNFEQHLASKNHQREATLKEKGLEHKRFSCDTCQIQCSGPENLEQHCKSKSHKRRLNLSTSDREDMFYCDKCDIKCTGIENYQQHITSKKHRKSTGEKKESQEKNDYYCNICHISCTGPEAFKQHKESKKHQKEVAVREGLNDAMLMCDLCHVPCTSMKNLQDHFASKSHKKQAGKLTLGKEFHCDICNIDCTGRETYDQHLQGQGHLKAVKKMKTNSSSEYCCNICKIECTGKETFEQHLHGQEHLKAIKNLQINDATDYFCNLCEISCTGPETYKQHIEGEKHIKKMGQLSEKNEKKWICDICNIECCGEENYKQHCNGKNHAKQSVRFHLLKNL